MCPSTGYPGKEYINRKSKPPALPDGRTSFDSSRSLASIDCRMSVSSFAYFESVTLYPMIYLEDFFSPRPERIIKMFSPAFRI